MAELRREQLVAWAAFVAILLILALAGGQDKATLARKERPMVTFGKSLDPSH